LGEGELRGGRSRNSRCNPVRLGPKDNLNPPWEKKAMEDQKEEAGKDYQSTGPEDGRDSASQKQIMTSEEKIRLREIEEISWGRQEVPIRRSGREKPGVKRKDRNKQNGVGVV